MRDFIERVSSENKSEEEIIKYWKDLGFLDGLDSIIIRKHTALAYQRAAKLLVSSSNSEYEKFETMIFPIIRRLISGVFNESKGYPFRGGTDDEILIKKEYIIKHLDVKLILDKLVSSFDMILNSIIIINDDNEIDEQAETVHSFCNIMDLALCRKMINYDVFKKQNGEILLFNNKV